MASATFLKSNAIREEGAYAAGRPLRARPKPPSQQRQRWVPRQVSKGQAMTPLAPATHCLLGNLAPTAVTRDSSRVLSSRVATRRA